MLQRQRGEVKRFGAVAPARFLLQKNAQQGRLSLTREIWCPGFSVFSTYATRASGSVHFLVRSNRQHEDRLRPFIFDKIEYDPQVVARATRPGAVQFTFEFVRLQTWMKAIYGEQFQSGLEVPGGLGMFLENFFCSTNERAGAQQEARQERISFIILSGVVGRSAPRLNSLRPSRTSSASSARRRSASRRFSTATRVSCSSTDKPSTASTTT